MTAALAIFRSSARADRAPHRCASGCLRRQVQTKPAAARPPSCPDPHTAAQDGAVLGPPPTPTPVLPRAPPTTPQGHCQPSSRLSVAGFTSCHLHCHPHCHQPSQDTRLPSVRATGLPVPLQISPRRALAGILKNVTQIWTPAHPPLSRSPLPQNAIRLLPAASPAPGYSPLRLLMQPTRGAARPTRSPTPRTQRLPPPARTRPGPLGQDLGPSERAAPSVWPSCFLPRGVFAV